MKLKIALLTLISLPITSDYQQPYNMPYSSIWPETMKGKNLSKKEKINIFITDCTNLSFQNPLAKKAASSIRIATYNVHIWADPHFKFHKDRTMLSKKIIDICATEHINPTTKVTPIFNVIENLDADILLLQEAASDTKEEFRDYQKILKAMGYRYGTEFFGNMNKDRDVPYGPFGNWILSRYPFMKNPEVFYFTKQAEPQAPWTKDDYVDRCVIHAKIQLPNDQILSVYVTHLDVFDVSETTRLEQIMELVDLIRTDQSENILLAGDLNSIRPQDYQKFPTLWELILADNLTHNESSSTVVLDYVQHNGFVDCFTLLNRLTPGFTTWSGTTIDFLMPQISQWHLPIVNAAVYFDAASDHVPVFMDMQLKSKNKSILQKKLPRRSSSTH